MAKKKPLDLLLLIRCSCGKQLKVHSRGWKLHIIKLDGYFVCPCGKIVDANVKEGA